MSEDVREFAAEKNLEEYLNGFKFGNDSGYTDFIHDGINKAREILNADTETGAKASNG